MSNPTGRFEPGNKGGPGRPPKKLATLHKRLLKEMKGSDVTAAMQVIRDVMKDGKASDKLAAARLILKVMASDGVVTEGLATMQADIEGIKATLAP